MKVRCINNEGMIGANLTIGKLYYVISDGCDHYKVIDDGGSAYSYKKSRFILAIF